MKIYKNFKHLFVIKNWSKFHSIVYKHFTVFLKRCNQWSYYALLFFLLFAPACKHESKEPLENMKQFGIEKSIHSTYLNEERKIWIYIPNGDPLYSVAHYPVIYLLDAESYFNSIVEMIQLFNEGHGNGALPKMIVIGIPNTDRMRDFTPSNDLNPSASSSIPISNDGTETSGGARKFTLFIRDELIPFMDSTYHTSGFRILIGHSLGGLMATNTLLNYTELFHGYIVIDPSIWWNHQEIIKQAKTFTETRSLKDIAFFYANSNTSKEVAKSIIDSTKNPYLAQLELGGYFMKNKQNFPNFSWIHYEQESHGSIPLIAIYDGLQIMTSYIHNNVARYNLSEISYRKQSNSNKLFKRLNKISINAKNYSKNTDLYILYNDHFHTSSNLKDLMDNMLKLKGNTNIEKEDLKKSFLFRYKNGLIKLFYRIKIYFTK
jgi:predicted alpha/beta superfamily hydrolase